MGEKQTESAPIDTQFHASDAATSGDDTNQLLVLRDDQIIKTVAKLQQRIEDRFPQCGLARLCGQLLDVSEQAAKRTAVIAKPILWIRVLGYTLALSLLGIILTLLVLGVQTFGLKSNELGVADFIQTFDAAASGCIFVSAAIYFLISLEKRIKRRRALVAVHELRSIAHIIDMHQLTKDPERVLQHWQATENSPKQSMTPFLLSRYLDYCSEMLSLTGKVAALYVERFDDNVAVEAVREVEQLTTGLSRKIWQKIIILNQARHEVVVDDAVTNAARSVESSNDHMRDGDAQLPVAL